MLTVAPLQQLFQKSLCNVVLGGKIALCFANIEVALSEWNDNLGKVLNALNECYTMK